MTHRKRGACLWANRQSDFHEAKVPSSVNALQRILVDAILLAFPSIPFSPAMFIPESPKPIKNPAPIERTPELSEAQLEALRSHWIISIQEFLALAELPATRSHLATLLETDEEHLSKLSKSARRQLSAMRGAEDETDEELVGLEYAAGALEPPPAMRAEVEYERIPRETPAPPALSYSDELPPVRNQGARGACVAHAAAAVRDFMEVQRLKRSGGDFDPKQVNFSEQFIYWWCKEHDGLPNVGGTYPYLGMKCLVEAGAPREQTWPYNPRPTPDNEGQGPPPKGAVEEARRYRLRRVIHLRPDDIDSMKAALLQGRSVMITIPMYNSWYRSRAARQYGKLNLPLPGEKSIGAHAMALVGYVDDEQAPGGGYFILRNAWKPWALKNPLGPGLATAPYEFLKKYNVIADAGELLVSADVYLRDNEEDEGDAPSRGLIFSSPDIWVRHKKDGGEAHQAPIPGKRNWVYVRAWNKGPETATNVQAELFTAAASPSIWPEMWRPAGTLDFPDIPPGESAVAVLPWRPDAHAPRRILARLSSAEDPAQHQWAVRYDNNIAQRNVVQIKLQPGQSATLDFPVYGLPDELTLRHIRVERRRLQRGRINLSIEKGQTFREKNVETEDEVLKAFAGQATETRTAALTIHMDERATPDDGGFILISQHYGKALIGRMMVEVLVIDDAGG